MRRRLATLLGPAALVALGAAVVLVGRAQPAGSAGARPGAAVSSAAQLPRAARALPSLGMLGTERRYAVELRARVEAQGAALVDYDVTALWLVAGVERRGGRLLVRSQLEGVKLVSSTARPDEADKLEDFERALGLVHFFTLDRHGALAEVRARRGMPSFAQCTLRWLLGAAQLVRGPEGARLWTAEEADAAGRYRASYEALGEGRFVKHKLEYLSAPVLGAGVAVGSGGGAGPASGVGLGAPMRPPATPMQVVESEVNLSSDADGALVSLTVRERTRAAASDLLPALESRAGLTLQLQGVAPAEPRLARLTEEQAATEASRPADPLPRSARQADVDQVKIGGRSLDELLGALHAAASAGAGPTDRATVTARARSYVGLAALLRQDAAARASAVTRIEQGDAQASALVDALGDAGDPESQRALVALLDSPRLDAKQRRGAMIALSLVDAPSAETVQALRTKLDDPALGTQASYGLGAAAYQLQQSEPQRSREALALLEERLASSTSSDSGFAVFLIAT